MLLAVRPQLKPLRDTGQELNGTLLKDLQWSGTRCRTFSRTLCPREDRAAPGHGLLRHLHLDHGPGPAPGPRGADLLALQARQGVPPQREGLPVRLAIFEIFAIVEFPRFACFSAIFAMRERHTTRY